MLIELQIYEQHVHSAISKKLVQKNYIKTIVVLLSLAIDNLVGNAKFNFYQIYLSKTLH